MRAQTCTCCQLNCLCRLSIVAQNHLLQHLNESNEERVNDRLLFVCSSVCLFVCLCLSTRLSGHMSCLLATITSYYLRIITGTTGCGQLRICMHGWPRTLKMRANQIELNELSECLWFGCDVHNWPLITEHWPYDTNNTHTRTSKLVSLNFA